MGSEMCIRDRVHLFSPVLDDGSTVTTFAQLGQNNMLDGRKPRPTEGTSRARKKSRLAFRSRGKNELRIQKTLS